MKILLVQPAKAPVTIGGEDYHVFEPLSLEYLAAPMMADHDVRILDLRFENDFQATLQGFSPDIIGITAYTVHVNMVKRLSDQIKKWNRQVLTVVGGHHASVAPEDFRFPSIDLVVRGEGVSTFKEIVGRLEKGVDFASIPGIAITKDGRWIQTDSAPLTNLDALPFPARKLTTKYRKRYYAE